MNITTPTNARIRANSTGSGGGMDALDDVVNSMISAGMNWLGANAGCPALYWALEPSRGTHAGAAVNSLVGHAFGYSERAAGAALEQWVRAWSMAATPEDLALREFGITQYTATVPYRPLGTVQLVVWGVTDRAAFERHLNSLIARRRRA